MLLTGTQLFAQDKPADKPAEDKAKKVLDQAYTGGYQGPSPSPAGSSGQQPGQTGSNGATSDTYNANPTTMDFITMILGLLVVIAIIYLIFWFLKKRMRGKIVENELIKILGSRVITGTKSLHLVEVGGAIYLVGSSNESLTLISEIAEKEAKDSIRLAASQAAGGTVRPRFVDALASMFKPAVKRQLEINESVDFMKKQRERLKKFKS
jgi:flagellar biogenesis protein FliO